MVIDLTAPYAQWQALGQLIAEREPARIGINVSRDWAIADGLSDAMHQRLVAVLPEGYESRLVSAQDLVVRWTETRLESERAHHAAAMQAARAVIAIFRPNLVTCPAARISWVIPSQGMSR